MHLEIYSVRQRVDRSLSHDTKSVVEEQENLRSACWPISRWNSAAAVGVGVADTVVVAVAVVVGDDESGVDAARPAMMER